MKLNKKEFLENCTYEIEHKETFDVITNNEWYKRSAHFGHFTIKLVHEDLDTDIKTEVCKVTVTKIPSSFHEYEKYLDYSMAQKMEFLDKDGLGEVARTLGLFDDGEVSPFEEKWEGDYSYMFSELYYGHLYVVTSIEVNKLYRGHKFGKMVIGDLTDIISEFACDEAPTVAVLAYPHGYSEKYKDHFESWHKRLYKFYSSCKNDLIEVTPKVFFFSPCAHVHNDKRLMPEE